MFPVVFSTNLFLYYVDESMLYAYALYVVALVGKATLRRDGRHIFNPSALGMSVMIGLELLVPSWMAHHVDVDHAFLLAPNMMELLFLVALAGQFRLPIVYTTLGAWLVLETGVGSFGIAPVSAYYPSTFIAILLLVTDPRTSARSPVGQLLYGAVYGLGYQWMSDGFQWSVGHDGGAKVLAVLPANLAAPWLDRVGASLQARVARAFAAHEAWVFVWIACVLFTWAGQPDRKQQFFDLWVPDHERNGTPWIRRDDEGRVTCATNPVFCRPFSFSEELRMWREDPLPLSVVDVGRPPGSIASR
jgi:hypothetical protein